MALCGFNQKMLTGISMFMEGLVEHGLVHRCEKNGETIDQGIKREISDMSRLLLENHRIDDHAKRVLTEGLVKYAQGFYLVMRRNDVGNYPKVITSIGEYFQFMDDKYYGELEGRHDDMAELARLLNQKEIK